ncbi:MAG: phage holin family protein [Caulobacterales bacterium]
MEGFIIKAIAAGLGLAAAAHFVPGVKFTSTASLVVAAILLGVVNALVKPVAVIVTLPLTIVTIGLFLFVLNGLLLWLVAAMLKGFTITGLWPAILGSIVVSIVSWVTLLVLGER